MKKIKAIFVAMDPVKSRKYIIRSDCNIFDEVVMIHILTNISEFIMLN